MSIKPLKVIQVGMGPLGIKINQFINERKGIEVVGAIDLNPSLIGKDLGEICSDQKNGIIIKASIDELKWEERPDAAILTTVSSMEKITPQIDAIVKHKINVVSTCEELSYPWETSPTFAYEIDKVAKIYNVSVVGTGINPGFLMDSLPAFLTSVCQKVERIHINRYQNAAVRRIPFQQKIGAGLTIEQFDERKLEGTLRHVGLTESMQFIADKMEWKLDKTEDIISPVIATNDMLEGVTVRKGNAAGVCQKGNGYVGGEKKISMTFQAAIGEEQSYDEILIEGEPRIVSRIEGGINGDVGTCAITVNAVKQIISAQPGLRTMADIPMVSYYE